MYQRHYNPISSTKEQAPVNDFKNARKRAAMESVVSRLTGKSTELFSFEDVASKLRVVSHTQGGVREIPVEDIVGSVGRYTDFSRTFLPRQESDVERWASVAAAPNFYDLPPIEVYQIGDYYFVLDGNHRVSVARQRGIEMIKAQVTEVRTKAPIPPDLNSDKLILQAEYVEFLENTQLDQLRPDANLTVSVPGQFSKLEDHIQVHRYFIEKDREQPLTDEEAVTHWYDQAYLPIVESVREQGILREFPNRTETDLYLWIAEHQGKLRDELGWQIRPEVAIANLADDFDPNNRGQMAKIGRNILNIVVPSGGKKAQSQSWSQMKTAARYSDRLFSDLLVVVFEDSENQSTVDQALDIAVREEARLLGLMPELAVDARPGPAAGSQPIEEWFKSQCEKVGLEGNLVLQPGDPIRTICERSVLADLIVCGRQSWGRMSPDEIDQKLISLIRESPRPVFIPAGKPISMDHVLLAYDGCAKSNEALFVAAYMAERWGVGLTVGLAPEAGFDEDKAVQHARNYLEMHEVEADYVVCELDPIRLVMDTANAKGAQLIVAGGYSERRFGRRGPGNIVNRLVTEWPDALLICP